MKHQFIYLALLEREARKKHRGDLLSWMKGRRAQVLCHKDNSIVNSLMAQTKDPE